MRSAATGPALAGAQERWGDDAALYAWIRNSQALIAEGHPRAVELWNQYKPTVMTAFPNLTDDEIGSMMAYINGVADGRAPAKTDAVAKGPVEEKSNLPMYLIIAAILAGLSLLLTKIILNLKQISAAKEGEEYEKKPSGRFLLQKEWLLF